MIDIGTAIGVIMLVFLAAGIVLVSWGLRGRVVSRGPHCKKCRFDLSSHAFVIDRALGMVVVDPGSDASEHAKCPECGGRLTPHASVVFELRKKRWGMALAGLVLFATPGVVVIASWNNGGPVVIVAQYSPDFLVVRLGEHDAVSEYSGELLHRIRPGGLSPETMCALGQRCIHRLRQNPPRNGVMSGDFFRDSGLLSALVQAGGVTPEEFSTLLGEPTIQLEIPSRARDRWSPRLSAQVSYPPVVVPYDMKFEVEVAPSEPTDLDGVLSPRRSQWTSDARFGLDSRSLNANEEYDLGRILPTTHGPAPDSREYRDIHLRVNIIIYCGKVAIKRVEGVRLDLRQEIVPNSERLLVLNMDPATNAAARAMFNGLFITRVSDGPDGTSVLDVGVPAARELQRAYYTIVARQAGQPDGPTVFRLSIPPRSTSWINDTWHTQANTRVQDADLPRLLDLTFTPDLDKAEADFFFANSRSSIPGETFTIENVPIR